MRAFAHPSSLSPLSLSDSSFHCFHLDNDGGSYMVPWHPTLFLTLFFIIAARGIFLKPRHNYLFPLRCYIFFKRWYHLLNWREIIIHIFVWDIIYTRIPLKIVCVSSLIFILILISKYEHKGKVRWRFTLIMIIVWGVEVIFNFLLWPFLYWFSF